MHCFHYEKSPVITELPMSHVSVEFEPNLGPRIQIYAAIQKDYTLATLSGPESVQFCNQFPPAKSPYNIQNNF